VGPAKDLDPAAIIYLTPHPRDIVKDGPAADSGGAGAPEIEITEEMEAAGARVLCSFETFTADEAYWAREVYRAMRIASVPK
jgi:hypothetical protein